MFTLDSPYIRNIPSPDLLKPQGDKYFVKTRDPKIMLTDGGLLIGGENIHAATEGDGKKKPEMYFGEVIARGEGMYSNNGEHIKPVFEVGDLIAFEMLHSFKVNQVTEQYSEDNTVVFLFMAESSIYFKVDTSGENPPTIDSLYGPAIPTDRQGKALNDVEGITAGDAINNHTPDTEILIG